MYFRSFLYLNMHEIENFNAYLERKYCQRKDKIITTALKSYLATNKSKIYFFIFVYLMLSRTGKILTISTAKV